MTRMCIFTLATLALASAPSHAQWADIGDASALSGKTIVDVGAVRAAAKLEPPQPTANRSPLSPPPFTRTTYYLVFKGAHTLCFAEDRRGNTTEVAALLLTQSDAQNLLLATLEPSANGVQVKVRQVQRLPCP
jgi:hypothetical protein